MRNKLLSIVFLLALLATAACTPQVTPTAAPTEAVTAAPTAEPVTLTVMAAASLTESFTEIGAMFEAQNPGIKVVFNFAGSQQLVEQLNQGAAADVFASASSKYMTSAVDAGLVKSENSKVFARNSLAVIFPKDNPAGITTLQDLMKTGLKLDLADESVPVGKYSVEFLDKASADTSFGADYKDNVLKNVVSYEDNVKAVLNKVALGEADAGIVYLTDITANVKDSVGTLEIPDELNSIATYPLARLTASQNSDLADAFVAFILSPEGQTVLSKYGFLPPQ